MINSRLIKTIEAEVMAKCYDKVMTGEFSQFDEDNVLMVHDQLKVDNTNEVEVVVDTMILTMKCTNMLQIQ